MLLDDGRILNNDGRTSAMPVWPRPFSETISLEGYAMASLPHGGAMTTTFDGRYIWSTLLSGMVYRIDPMTGVYKSIQLSVNGVNLNDTCYVAACDEQYIWFFPADKDYLIKMDPITLNTEKIMLINGVNGNANIPDGSYTCFSCVYDGSYLWFTEYESAKILRLDPVRNTVKGYDLPAGITGGLLTLTEEYFWMTLDNRRIAKIKKADMSTDIFDYSHVTLFDGDQYNSVNNGYYDGRYIWYTGYIKPGFLKVDTQTNEITGVAFTGDNMGDAGTTQPINYLKYFRAAFDGRYLWYMPYVANRIIRLDTADGTMKGFDLIGTNLGNYPSVNFKVHTMAYDGRNIWQLPASSNRLVKMSPTDRGEFIEIDELCQDEDGQSIRPDVKKLAIPGEQFLTKAPLIEGYSYVGHKIDNGTLSTERKAYIDSVDANGHEVVFVYKAAGSSGGDGDGDGGNNGKCCCRPIIIYNCCKCHEEHKCNIIDKDCCCGE